MGCKYFSQIFWRLMWSGLIAAAISAPAVANENDAELSALRKNIQSLQLKLDQTRDARDEARAALRPVERRISNEIKALRGTNRELVASNNKLGQLKRRQHSARISMRQQSQELGLHARAAYVLGRQNQLKLLLNQQDPTTFGRMLTYYRYFADARSSRINILKNDLRQITQLESSVLRQHRTLVLIKQRRQRESKKLQQSRYNRASLLASLDREVHSSTQKIARLKRDENRLDNLMRGLPPVAARNLRTNKFSLARGRLPLPVRGRVTVRFGTRRPLGDLKWKGIFLATATGKEVKAVFDGRVVYANWLQGYGLLMILEHGDGYMTLYGNNESLTQQVGDQIEAGSVIALTGNTGNIAQSGLYFEVRHQGKPKNPLRWCRRG